MAKSKTEFEKPKDPKALAKKIASNAGTLVGDIIAKKSSEILFIEAKILTSETKAAQALGQLLFYQHSVKATEKATKLILLFDRKPQNETIEFIKKYRIDEIVYESKKDFIFCKFNDEIKSFSKRTIWWRTTKSCHSKIFNK